MLSDNCVFIAVGFSMLGLTGVIIGIPLIAEQNAMTVEYFGAEKAKSLSDLNASIFTASQAFGLILGPIFGTYSAHYQGFRATSDIMACMTCISVFMYLFIGNGFNAMLNPWKKI